MSKSEGIKLFFIGCLFISLLQRADALNINVTYDVSVSNAVNSAQIQSAFNTAVQIIETLYTNPITVNIAVYWGATGPFSGGISLGESQSEVIGTISYAQLTNALRNARTTAIASNAVASLPPSDPIANNQWWIPRPEIKALGIGGLGVSANDTNNDGDVGFASA